MKENTYTIVVLSDGETWTTINDCEILVLDESNFIDLAEGWKRLDEIEVLAEITLGQA